MDNMGGASGMAEGQLVTV